MQVRDVPDEVHEALVRRAEQAGQSLQQFLAAQLGLIAATPTPEDILDRIESRSKGELSAATTDGFGDFWFEGLKVGNYALLIEKRGYAPNEIKPISTEKDVNLGDIKLNKRE